MAKMTLPDDLSATAAAWVRKVVKQVDMKLDSEIACTIEAARSLDRIEQCREILQREGLTVEGARGTVLHSAARLEQQHRALFLAACRAVGISNAYRP